MKQLNQKHLLAYVDDAIMLREAHAAVINDYDSFEVLFQADNGKDFINKLEAQLKISKEPEIVIVDIDMPEMNGFETCRWLNENHPHIKKLVLTIHVTENDIVTMVEAGANGFLSKFLKPGEFKKALTFLIKNDFYLSELVSPALLSRVRSGAKKKISLNENEITFLKLCCRDISYIEIADLMCKSVKRIYDFVDDLKEKLNVNGRMGFVLYAIQTGLVRLNAMGEFI